MGLRADQLMECIGAEHLSRTVKLFRNGYEF